jgi:glutamyl endopeptidase
MKKSEKKSLLLTLLFMIFAVTFLARAVETVEDPTAVVEYHVSSGEVIVVPSDHPSRQPIESDLNSIQPCEGLLPSEIMPETGIVPLSVIGDDDRVLIDQTIEYPWRTICRLFMYYSDGWSFRGSGALIGPSDCHGFHVLTAGHCIYNHEHGGFPYKTVVIPGYDNMYEPYGRARVTIYRTYSGWIEDKDKNHDWAVCTLDRNIGDYTGRMGLKTDDKDSWIYEALANTAGYPDKVRDENPAGYYLYWDADYGLYATERKHYYLMDASGGQSGGPVWIYVENEDRYIISIHTTGDASDPPQWNYGTRLDSTKFNDAVSWCRTDTPPYDYPDLIDGGEAYSGFSPTRVKHGETFSVWCRVHNIGTAPSGEFYVSFYASTDEVITSSDYLIGSISVGSVLPGPFCTEDVSWSGIFPSNIPEDKDYWIGWIIDSRDDVLEFDDYNNKAHKTSYQLSVEDDGTGEGVSGVMIPRFQ